MKLHFVRSIRGLQNFLTITIMNTLAGFMIQSTVLVLHGLIQPTMRACVKVY